MKRAKKPSLKNRTANQLYKAPAAKVPFIEHIYELRKRIFYVALSVVICGSVSYGIEHHIVDALLRPAHGQKFIYTSPGGGIDFLFRICLYTGIAASIPVIIYQLLKYLEPLIKKDSVQFVARGSIVSGFLAIAGLAFGYFIGLPAALYFLLHQFTTHQITAMITIQSYMSFVLMYLVGSAMLFQLPLILLFINRVKPLDPKKLLGLERWVILGAFIGGGIMNPSPNVIDQLMLAGPMIIMYQIGIAIIWYVNRGTRVKRPKQFDQMLANDEENRSARMRKLEVAREQLESQLQKKRQVVSIAPTISGHTPVAVTAVQKNTKQVSTSSALKQPVSTPVRRNSRITSKGTTRHLYVNDFTPSRLNPQVPNPPNPDQSYA